jgi:hypothetical protein
MRRHRLNTPYTLESLRDIYGDTFGLVASDRRPRREPIRTFTDFDAAHAEVWTRIAGLVARHGGPACRAWAAGSRVKGNWLPDSDWDIVVDGPLDIRACRADALNDGIRLDVISLKYPLARHCVPLPRSADHA